MSMFPGHYVHQVLYLQSPYIPGHSNFLEENRMFKNKNPFFHQEHFNFWLQKKAHYVLRVIKFFSWKRTLCSQCSYIFLEKDQDVLRVIRYIFFLKKNTVFSGSLYFSRRRSWCSQGRYIFLEKECCILMVIFFLEKRHYVLSVFTFFLEKELISRVINVCFFLFFRKSMLYSVITLFLEKEHYVPTVIIFF